MSSRSQQYRTGIFAIVGVLGLALVVASCATTRATRARVEPAGFLGDYSQLTPGDKGEAQFLYVNPTTDFARYDAIMIDSVTIWRDAQTEGIDADDQQVLTDYLYATLHEHLRKDYRIADSPGPGVMRLRAAITEARGAKVVLNTVTSIVPQLRVLTTLGGLATDTAVFVGKAGIEMELTDSMNDHLLGAAVDQRVGTKALRGGLATWSDVKTAFDYWADRTAKRLAELRQR